MVKKIIDSSEIIKEYQELCFSHNKVLTRAEYRQLNTLVSSTEIEKLWGTWTNFVKTAITSVEINRRAIQKVIDADKVVVTSVQDGSDINLDVLETLEFYCKHNSAELVILWGKPVTKDDTFKSDVYNRIKKYLATDVVLSKDSSVVIHDYMISPFAKNPLVNLDKISTKFRMIVTGSTKQYMQVLPYKQEDLPRIAYTTGTISNVIYGDSVAKQLDADFNTFGAVLLTKDDKNIYYPRNLIYKNDEIRDLKKVYTAHSVKNADISTIILGDMHFPEEDTEEVSRIVDFIQNNSIKNVILHDIASWESINHHESYNFLDKVVNKTIDTACLEDEYNAVAKKLENFTKRLKAQNIYVVHSNHDDFITKWLNDGNFVKDSVNAIFGARLFITYSEGKSIYNPFSTIANLKFLENNSKFELEGFQLGEHGDKGISGSRGNNKLFTKAFSKAVTGHTHSPAIFENSVVVGTNSKLRLRYNQTGFTNWAHANVILHENGTHQMLF
jgi:predicted phosphodiesterase